MSRDGESQFGESSTNGSIFGLLRAHSGRMCIVIVLLIALALTDLAPPLAIKLLIDDVFQESDLSDSFGGQWKLLGVILIGLFLSYITRNVLFYSSRMLSLQTSEDVCFSLRKQLFDHLQQLSLRFYRSNQPGRVVARVMDDTYKIQTFIQDKFPLLLLNFLKFQILIVVISVMNIKLALAAIIILPLQFMTYRVFRAPIKMSHTQAQETLSLAYGSVVEKFLGIEVVKGFSAEARESATFHQAIDETRKSQIKSQRLHFAQKVAADLLVGLGTILLLAYGAFEVIKGNMKGGEFMMFFGYVMMLYPSVLEIISGVGHSTKAAASVGRVFDMLDEPIHDEGVLASRSVGADSEPLEGTISFEHVEFVFDDSTVVLEDISFTIKAGERVAITGPSGSGKSTTINLIPRFIAPSSGTIRIGGQDTSKLPLATIRASVGIAFQEVFLFNATIYENLRYASPNAKREEVEAVCRLTGADTVISALPKGYETKLADYGVELSRGEKQRITLARALLKDAPILIFDEATASIDRESSHQIMKTIASSMSDRTILMVTHEAYLLDMVDRVICIRDGRVCFNGPPEEYMEREFGGSVVSSSDHNSTQTHQPHTELASGESSDEIGDENSTSDSPPATTTGYIEPHTEHGDGANARDMIDHEQGLSNPSQGD
ncbi:MAG: ABC transporter ATP-binding protein [Phycisphaerales bacterium]|nr:ABC transporter ATP-binding protein [Phycisphaerales bacterium]